MNSRELAEKIWNLAVVNAYQAAHDEHLEPEAEDKEAALQCIEGFLELHAGMKPDEKLEQARRENEKNGISY